MCVSLVGWAGGQRQQRQCGAVRVKPTRLWCTGVERERERVGKKEGWISACFSSLLPLASRLPPPLLSPQEDMCAARKWAPLAANPDLSLLIHHRASSSPGAAHGSSPPPAEKPATPDRCANTFASKCFIYTHSRGGARSTHLKIIQVGDLVKKRRYKIYF